MWLITCIITAWEVSAADNALSIWGPMTPKGRLTNYAVLTGDTPPLEGVLLMLRRGCASEASCIVIGSLARCKQRQPSRPADGKVSSTMLPWLAARTG